MVRGITHTVGSSKKISRAIPERTPAEMALKKSQISEAIPRAILEGIPTGNPEGSFIRKYTE